MIERGGGDLWKDRVQSLQLRLRKRFRVGIDRHHRISDGYFSSKMRRFRTNSLPSSSTFYRKTVSLDIDAEEDSILTRMLQAVAVPIIGNACHVFMHGLNRVQIYGAEKLHQAVLHRPDKKSLITVSNHVASMDDPLVIASLIPPSILFDAHSLRWTLCATDRCFRSPATAAFFKYVKVLPVSRGDGIYQKGMDMAILKLNRGGWVHIFPEGSRSRDGGRTIGSTKRGIGRLILDADTIPMVVPFVHTGMQDIMPIGAKFPRIGKTVTVVIGDPIDFDDLVNDNVEENQNVSRGKLYDAVSARIGDRLQKLKSQVDRLALEQQLQSKNHPWRVTERTEGILQQVDWESLGMESYMGNHSILTTEGESVAEHGKFEIIQPQENDSSPHTYLKMGVSFSYEGAFVSRIRGYVDPTELMGFAARGLFVNRRLIKQNSANVDGIGPLKAWNNFWKQVYASCGNPAISSI